MVGLGDLQKDFTDGKSKILTCEKSSYLEVTRRTRPHTPVLPSRSFPLCRPGLFVPFFPFAAAFGVWLLGCVLPFVTL